MKMFEFRAHNNRYTSFQRPSQGAYRSMLPLKFLEYIVNLCFERHYPKKNSVIRLKSQRLCWLPVLPDGCYIKKIVSRKTARSCWNRVTKNCQILLKTMPQIFS